MVSGGTLPLVRNGLTMNVLILPRNSTSTHRSIHNNKITIYAISLVLDFDFALLEDADRLFP
ncbi:hypothetical protein V1477_007011 [Vespula maculifrons]|uniref:Uncharacterized protein n=1 Tax=Vespula maculifrons TaxID=7453 RepID=A0ABD2CHW0_VESMC